MEVRLTVVLVLACWMAGCGSSSDRPADRTQPAPKDKPVAGQDAGGQAGNSLAGLAETAVERQPGDPGRAASAGKPDHPEVEQVAPPLRKWFDASGKLLAVAEFIALEGDKVCLQKQNGEGTVIPMRKLCEADREFVRTVADADLADPEEGPTDQELSDAAESLAGDPAENPEVLMAGAPSTPSDYAASSRQKVVIPFDFVSKFDEGRYGRMVGDLVWKKIEGEGGFLLPESMNDVRDLCTANNLQITPGTPLDQVSNAVRNHFQADIGIWGSVERAPGHEWDVYDLTIKCVDFSGPQPQVVYEVNNVRTQVVSEIPHLYVQQMLDKLYDRQPGGPPPVDVLAEENWKNNPSLVVGGDFERGNRGVPIGWEAVGGHHRDPLGGVVKWTTEAGNSYNRVIRFEFPKSVGDSTGVMYYSDWFPIEEGAKYRFQCRYRTNGPSPMVFIKCYPEMPSEYRPASEIFPAESNFRASRGRPGRNDYVPETFERRVAYRSQQNLKGPKNVWNVHTQDFTPKHTKYVPRWGRVDLYAYLGGGVVEWDDVVLKQIVPASPSDSKKDLRHSMESTVTIDEMRENERRGAEASERVRQRPP